MRPQRLLALTTLLPFAVACGSDPAVEGYMQARLDFVTLICACDPDGGLNPDWERSECEREGQEAAFLADIDDCYVGYDWHARFEPPMP